MRNFNKQRKTIGQEYEIKKKINMKQFKKNENNFILPSLRFVTNHLNFQTSIFITVQKHKIDFI